MMWWIAFAIACVAVAVVVRRAVKSAETLEELERAWHDRQSYRRTKEEKL